MLFLGLLCCRSGSAGAVGLFRCCVLILGISLLRISGAMVFSSFFCGVFLSIF